MLLALSREPGKEEVGPSFQQETLGIPSGEREQRPLGFVDGFGDGGGDGGAAGTDTLDKRGKGEDACTLLLGTGRSIVQS